jgi:transposase-like protein
MQRFTPLLADAARFVARHAPGNRWFVDETYVKVGGVWRYVPSRPITASSNTGSDPCADYIATIPRK